MAAAVPPADPLRVCTAPSSTMPSSEMTTDATLRFSVGDRVECHMPPGPGEPENAPGTAEPGTIAGLWYQEADMPKPVPYQIQLDRGELVMAPADLDACVRARDPDDDAAAAEDAAAEVAARPAPAEKPIDDELREMFKNMEAEGPEFDASLPGASMANLWKRILPAEDFIFRDDDDVKRCAACGKGDARLLCTRCRAVRYCDRGCQRQGWKAHKSNCPTRDQRVQSLLNVLERRAGPIPSKDDGEATPPTPRAAVELALDICGERWHCARFVICALRNPDSLFATYDDEEFCAAIRLCWGAKLKPADFSRLCASFPAADRLIKAARSRDDAEYAATLRRLAPVHASCKRIYELLTVRKKGDPEPMACVTVLRDTSPGRHHKTNRELLDFIYLRTVPEPVEGGPPLIFRSLSQAPCRLFSEERDKLLYGTSKSTKRKHAPHHNIPDFLALVEDFCRPPYAPLGAPKPKHAAANRALLADRLPALVRTAFLDYARAMGEFYGLSDAELDDDPDGAIELIKARNFIAKRRMGEQSMEAYMSQPGFWAAKDTLPADDPRRAV